MDHGRPDSEAIRLRHRSSSRHRQSNADEAFSYVFADAHRDFSKPRKLVVHRIVFRSQTLAILFLALPHGGYAVCRSATSPHGCNRRKTSCTRFSAPSGTTKLP